MESSQPEPDYTAFDKEEFEAALLLHPEEERPALRLGVERGVLTMGSLRFLAQAKEDLGKEKKEAVTASQ